MADQNGFTFTEEACVKLTYLFNNARNERNFGNGRYVRNVIEKAMMAQASRIMNKDFDSIKDEDIKFITAEDIELPSPKLLQDSKKIGFCA